MASHTEFSRAWRNAGKTRHVMKGKSEMKISCSKYARRRVRTIIRNTEDFDALVHLVKPRYSDYDVG